ncbi:uncharacterized protein VP01_318g5 [Puccinia sorghi]|uniref:RlpA-like protein double-psi beta-barrel domain-containing protein n=1 Tax=Puccinia sorghi TaxID=27349 RepID=A0A0L6UZD3_9BASI|nr:uncharacterized protein VP01_318g5 [Puccinia sorghi]
MKSSTITLALTLALSCSSSVSAMPRYHDSVSDISLSVRAPVTWMKRSLLEGRSAGYTPETLLKRVTENRNGKFSSLAKRGESDDDGDDDDDDAGDDCDELSDAYEDVKSLGANHYNEIDSNATNAGGSTHSSSQPNPYYQHAQDSEEKTPNYSKSQSPKKWDQSSAQTSKVTKLASNPGSSSSQSYSTSSSHVQYGESYGASQASESESSYHGKATFFSQDGNPGACGKTHQDSDFVVAIQSEMYGGGKFCGKTIIVTRKSTGHSIKCVAADECPGCPTDQSLDLSIAAFNALGDPDEGVFDISWEVME